MLNSVEIITKSGSSLVVPLGESTNGYQVRNIDGLGPVPVSFASSGLAQLDGEQFQGAQAEPRNILMWLGLEPNFVTTTVASLRQNLYRYMMPRQEVQLRFSTDEFPLLEIDARVETMDPDIFSSDPALVISFRSFEQVHFQALNATVLDQNVVIDGATENIFYDGTIPTGFVYETTTVAEMENFFISQDLPNQLGRVLSIKGSFPAGATLRVSTVPGNKGAWVKLAGETEFVSILGRVAPNSVWIRLEPGSNGLRVYGTSASDGEISFYETHGGI